MKPFTLTICDSMYVILVQKKVKLQGMYPQWPTPQWPISGQVRKLADFFERKKISAKYASWPIFRKSGIFGIK